jgi:hexosaminidase
MRRDQDNRMVQTMEGSAVRYRSWLVYVVLAVGVITSGCQTVPSEEAPAIAAAPALPPTPPNAEAHAAARLFGELNFLPQPRRLSFGQGGFLVGDVVLSATVDGRFAPAVNAAFEGLADYLRQDGAPAAELPVACRLMAGAGIPAQGYALNIGPQGITVTAADDAGAFYGAMTLRQLLRQAAPSGVLPFLLITDHPDFPHRGAMLDISRDKVPTLETLRSLVDQFAEWKFNELQLYTEHTFAYAGHDVIWQHASPMTPGDIQALDAYCRDRFIDLVPNQNSFGHMARWLRHPDYAHLAERPAIGYMLCPVDPDAIAFLGGLYADLLPNFSSGMFNVGCDEAYAIGRGRSQAAVATRGVGRVYLDFLLEIYELVTAHGKTMQFWGDIILEHPNLIAELPKDVVAMNWGYEANHPFAKQTAQFAAAGVPFYVAPGTSSWNALIGRTDNAIANLRNAALHGRDNGAIGYLVTDWGDGGHWQFLPVSYVGFASAAAFSWCLDANRDLDLQHALDTHVFYDEAGVMGAVAYTLGNAYQQTEVLIGNNTAFNHMLRARPQDPVRTQHLPLRVDALERTVAYIERAAAPVANARLRRSDAELVQHEFMTGAAMAAFACKLSIARLRSGDTGIAAIPAPERAALAAEWEGILADYERLWLARNRPGGLPDSVAQFHAILAALR